MPEEKSDNELDQSTFMQMTNNQLYLAIGIPTLAIMLGFLGLVLLGAARSMFRR